MRRISKHEARLWILERQGLLLPSEGDAAGRAAVERLGYVQIDTISVVQRAHHHVLWSRVRDHEPRRLAQWLADRHVFEYWSHAASYLPMRDFRFSLPRKRLYANGRSHWFTPTDEHKRWRRRILAQIRERGGQTARDFAAPEANKRSGWFDWKPAKQSLEQLFMEGVLMVSERRGFNKVFDFTERVLPSTVDTRFPKPAEYARHLIETFLRAQALGRPEQIAYLRRGPLQSLVRRECRNLLREGFLSEVHVEGIELPFLHLSGDAAPSSRGEGSCAILSPFDNLLIQRKRVREIFDFDYTIECYVPVHKRKFGYFGLPVLLDGELVGQLDLKADRASERLLVQGRHLPRLNGAQKEKLERELQAFAAFNACPRIVRPRARTRSPLAPEALG